MSTSASYYDGHESCSHPARLYCNGRTLKVALAERALLYPLADCRLESRLSSQPRRIRLPDGALLECPVDAGVENWFTRDTQWLHRLESHWRWTAYSLLGLIACGTAFYMWGIPLAARIASYATPVQLERMLGDSSYDGIRRMQMVENSSAVDINRQTSLARALHGMQPGDTRYHYRLVFRNAPRIGPNAFALPGGLIVVTDQLSLKSSDKQVLAVLAHEMGHVEHRHGLRMLYQSSGIALGISLFLGDMPGAAANMASVGAILLQLGYSRDFERDADAFAVERLRLQHESPALLASALQTLLDSQPAKGEQIPQFLSSHPEIHERIRLLQQSKP